MSTKDLDFGNVIKMVYDPPTESLKVLATISIGSVSVDLDAATDSVRLGDGVLLNTLTNVGGKNALDVNIAGGSLAIIIDHADDSIRLGDGTTLFTGSTIGPKTGLDVAIISSTLPSGASTEAKQDNQITLLSSIDTKLGNPLAVTVALEAFTGVSPDNVQLVGSIDGTKTGTKYGFVNNIRQQILSSQDRTADFTYADFGTKNQRVTRVDYSSATFPGFTLRRDFSYTLTSGQYRRDDEVWSVV